MLVIINKVASIAVAFVRKFPADLEETKLSCEAPIPNAPPSDFCKRITITNRHARITFIIKIKFLSLF